MNERVYDLLSCTGMHVFSSDSTGYIVDTTLDHQPGLLPKEKLGTVHCTDVSLRGDIGQGEIQAHLETSE